MKRKRLVTVPKTTRKRLKTIDEQIDTPSRPDPTSIRVGVKKEFKAWELRKLAGQGIDKVYENTWLVVFSGPGYIDVARCASRKSAQSAVSMFKLRYKGVKIEWLTGESNASANHAARGASTNTDRNTSKRKRLVHSQSKPSSTKRKRLKS